MATKTLTKAQRLKQDLTNIRERDARMDAHEARAHFFKGRIVKAQVRWFDRTSGEAWVRGLNGEGDFHLYACSDSRTCRSNTGVIR